jgi:hypothetical protein
LFGAMGFCYADDSARVNSSDCQLVVETKAGLLRFKLDGRRLDKTCMNKFHVNVPAASQPRAYAVLCGGKVVAQRAITPVAEKLTVNVNGYVPPAK